jgi:D-alanine transaminase/branched-chain amino acid aminotransferase
MYVFLNDQFVEAEKATLHISDLAIQRGYGIFDFFRVRDNVLLYVEDHLDRFLRSASFMHLESPYSKDLLLVILHDLIEKNNAPHAGIRMILTGGYSPNAYEPVKPNFIIQQSALTFQDSPIPKSVSVITHEFVRDLPEAKTINYSMGIWLQRKIKEAKADDVLYYTAQGVTEFPRCNFFIVNQDNVVITPKHHALAGVTRKKILEHGQKLYTIQEGYIGLNDIYQAKEAFLTSSTKRIQAVVKINGQPIGNGQPGKVTTDLLNMMIALEQEYVRKPILNS